MSWLFDFFPVPDAAPLSYELEGDALAVNGTAYDFGPLGEAESIPGSAIPGAASWLRSAEVTRWDGLLRLCVAMPFESAEEHRMPSEMRHPAPVQVENGRVPLPTDQPLLPEPESAQEPAP